MYGLAVNLIMSVSGHPSIINEILKTNFVSADGLMPSPSTSSKFGSSILKFFKHAQFFMYTQNRLGILKS